MGQGRAPAAFRGQRRGEGSRAVGTRRWWPACAGLEGREEQHGPEKLRIFQILLFFIDC